MRPPTPAETLDLRNITKTLLNFLPTLAAIDYWQVRSLSQLIQTCLNDTLCSPVPNWSRADPGRSYISWHFKNMPSGLTGGLAAQVQIWPVLDSTYTTSSSSPAASRFLASLTSWKQQKHFYSALKPPAYIFGSSDLFMIFWVLPLGESRTTWIYTFFFQWEWVFPLSIIGRGKLK